MEPRTQLNFRKLQPNRDIETYVDQRISRLHAAKYGLEHCAVTVSGNGRHRHGGPYEVSIGGRMRGEHINVTQQGPDVFKTVRSAFDALANRLRHSHQDGKRRSSRPPPRAAGLL